jgi:hypothetical protein
MAKNAAGLEPVKTIDLDEHQRRIDRLLQIQDHQGKIIRQLRGKLAVAVRDDVADRNLAKLYQMERDKFIVEARKMRALLTVAVETLQGRRPEETNGILAVGLKTLAGPLGGSQAVSEVMGKK